MLRISPGRYLAFLLAAITLTACGPSYSYSGEGGDYEGQEDDYPHGYDPGAYGLDEYGLSEDELRELAEDGYGPYDIDEDVVADYGFGDGGHGSGGYHDDDGDWTTSPGYYDEEPGGASAICADGTYSFSDDAEGTCSWHGGVDVWL